jgi:YfiH family protein
MPAISHGFFTRQGGVSKGLYASLNCGLGSGDDPAAVVENRARAVAGLGLRHAALATACQIHSARAVTVDEDWPAGLRPEADGLVTTRRGLAIGVLSADCVPILFADPSVPVIGAAHAGWKGAVTGIAEATVEAMCRLGARPGCIRAGIGPAIRQVSYEVGPEFPSRFADGPEFFVPSSREGHFRFDLPGYVGARLSRLGLASIEDVGLDTSGDAENFFSYRRANQRGERDYGRMISAISIL